ncbi:Rossmann-like fold-containing protein [Pseudoalteromonas aurantia]|uniref:25S rRNA (uridine-N(3))-methyltransferase BMT5-like domain-containing protein n=1 Tax=Pseudoalteromonas aurantia 208 TaxID=1314867 RepID=A0ABR9EJ47_9GAMM|nr:Rossmann-like fold-containing protein [Pseudoalteromonas aurantia]MBE0370929.1 hypothetical protein [Pseudoalteromonas aurantia 208]
MILNKQWRILTVGDGDLSFSLALLNNLHPQHLTASIYDSELQLREKYQSHSLDVLQENHIEVYTEFDVTQPESWQRIKQQSFDVVIFQFPLIPGFTSKGEFDTQALSVNTLNRRLLRYFLLFADRYALDPHGEMLCYITSKDVKPYCEWDLESSLNIGLDIKYLGQSPFDITLFDGYRIRNVDRDKHVKDTSGTTYVWSRKCNPYLKNKLTKPYYLADNHCALCRAGPFMTTKDQLAHLNSKKHRTMLRHQNDWYKHLGLSEIYENRTL